MPYNPLATAQLPGHFPQSVDGHPSASTIVMVSSSPTLLRPKIRLVDKPPTGARPPQQSLQSTLAPLIRAFPKAKKAVRPLPSACTANAQQPPVPMGSASHPQVATATATVPVSSLGSAQSSTLASPTTSTSKPTLRPLPTVPQSATFQPEAHPQSAPAFDGTRSLEHTSDRDSGDSGSASGSSSPSYSSPPFSSAKLNPKGNVRPLPPTPPPAPTIEILGTQTALSENAVHAQQPVPLVIVVPPPAKPTLSRSRTLPCPSTRQDGREKKHVDVERPLPTSHCAETRPTETRSSFRGSRSTWKRRPITLTSESDSESDCEADDDKVKYAVISDLSRNNTTTTVATLGHGAGFYAFPPTPATATPPAPSPRTPRAGLIDRCDSRGNRLFNHLRMKPNRHHELILMASSISRMKSTAEHRKRVSDFNIYSSDSSSESEESDSDSDRDGLEGDYQVDSRATTMAMARSTSMTSARTAMRNRSQQATPSARSRRSASRSRDIAYDDNRGGSPIRGTYPARQQQQQQQQEEEHQSSNHTRNVSSASSSSSSTLSVPPAPRTLPPIPPISPFSPLDLSETPMPSLSTSLLDAENNDIRDACATPPGQWPLPKLVLPGIGVVDDESHYHKCTANGLSTPAQFLNELSPWKRQTVFNIMSSLAHADEEAESGNGWLHRPGAGASCSENTDSESEWDGERVEGAAAGGVDSAAIERGIRKKIREVSWEYARRTGRAVRAPLLIKKLTSTSKRWVKEKSGRMRWCEEDYRNVLGLLKRLQ